MTLRLGDIAPNFQQESSEGTIDFYEYLADGWGILFSHPADFTPVCTTELGFTAKLKDEFTKRGVKAIALSVDDVESHKQFSDKHSLPFLLLADEKNVVRNLFKVPRNLFGLIPGRVTYVVNENGVVVKIFDSLFQAEKHIEEAKKTVSEM